MKQQKLRLASLCLNELTEASIHLYCSAADIRDNALLLLGEVCASANQGPEAVRGVIQLLKTADELTVRAKALSARETRLRTGITNR
jgi:hypothetical protein